METPTTGRETKTRGFPRTLEDPEVETIPFIGSPWSVRIAAFASSGLIDAYPEISVSVCYAAKSDPVCVQGFDNHDGPGLTPWESLKSNIMAMIKARLDRSQALYCPEDMKNVASALDESRRQAFLRTVRVQARSYLRVIAADEASRVWHEEEVNLILNQ
jgi:hypothetical protein